MNYRAIYEKHYGIKIPKGYAIHHIDRNRENNEISNLLLLPARVHSQLHFAGNIIEKYNYAIFSIEPNIYLAKAVFAYGKALVEASKWAEIKQYEDIVNGGMGLFSYKKFRNGSAKIQNR